MIISTGRRYVFVHIPKTGGTALGLALESRAMRDDILIGDTPKARARRRRLAGLSAPGRLWKHARLADVDGMLPGHDLGAFFVVTLVRNPWDRMVSYYHWLRVQRFDHPAVRLAKSRDFSTFLHHPETEAAFRAAPCAAYTCDRSGQQRASLFARIECLETDLRPFEDHLGFRLTPLARVNASDRDRDYRVYYDAAGARQVGRICAEDAEQFGYGF